MLLIESAHWSTLIIQIIQTYFTDALTVCLLLNNNIEFDLGMLQDAAVRNAFLNIRRSNVRELFDEDVYDFNALEEKFENRSLAYDDLVMKLTAAIQHSYCEAFIVFQEEIPIFVKAFRKAVSYSQFRLRRARFLFAYYMDMQLEPYFDDKLFVDQPNILIIEGESKNSTKFNLKTNKFVGSLNAHPNQLYILDTYDVIVNEFAAKRNLYPDKLKDVQGRELIVAAFDYRPMVVYDYNITPQWYDHSADNPQHSVYIDGTEVQVLLNFCRLRNCTVQVDTSEKGDWGEVYPNGTGVGLMGMVLDGSAHIALDALYTYDTDYIEVTNYLGRSGVACLVPRPVLKSSWAMLLRPFQFWLWFALILCLLIEMFSLFAVRHVELNLDKDRQKDINWLDNFKFGYAITLKLLISQGANYIVSTPALRMLLLTCYMIDIVIESVYNGGLASILTVPTLTEAADTVERLSRFNLIWTATSDYWTDTIAFDTNPIISNIYRNFRANTFDDMRDFAKYKNMAFAVERLAYGHFGNGEYLTPEALNRLKLMHDDIYFQYTMPYVQRLWPFLDKYNNLIAAWHASGFTKYWEWKVVADFVGIHQQEQVKSSSDTQNNAGPVPLGMDNFAGLILIWFLGIGASIICFVFELIFYQKYKRRKMNSA